MKNTETELGFKKNVKSFILDFFHPGIYCIRRCGFYKGNYSIQTKKYMIEEGSYDDKKGCNGLPWVAFEGKYSECDQWYDRNQTHHETDY